MENQPYFVKNLKTNNIVQITGGNAHYFSKTVPNNPDEVYLDADYQIIGSVELSVPEVDTYLEEKLIETQKRVDDVSQREIDVLARETKADEREKGLNEREALLTHNEKNTVVVAPEKKKGGRPKKTK